jgi:hypothetical protein
MITLNLEFRSATDAQLNRINDLIADKLLRDCAFSGAVIEVNEFADFTHVDSGDDINEYDAIIFVREVHRILDNEDLDED